MVEAKTSQHVLRTHEEPSIVRGGPFYKAQKAVRLILPNQWNLVRRVIFFVAIAWLPLSSQQRCLTPPPLLRF